jgi:hypothetical protein
LLRARQNGVVQGARRKDMPGIFDDEQHRTGSFWRRRFAVGPKSPLTALKMLESAQHFLALFALSGAILVSNAVKR